MPDHSTDRENAFQGVAMDLALQIAGRGPNLNGPSREQLLVLAGIARELTHRNVVINQLSQELWTMVSYVHAGHETKGLPLSPLQCPTETCRRVVGLIKAAEAVAVSATAIPVGE